MKIKYKNKVIDIDPVFANRLVKSGKAKTIGDKTTRKKKTDTSKEDEKKE